MEGALFKSPACHAAGKSDIVCPLCIDVDASHHHAIFPEEYGNLGDDVSQEEYDLLDEWAQERAERTTVTANPWN